MLFCEDTGCFPLLIAVTTIGVLDSGGFVKILPTVPIGVELNA
jgi:hypothetical protein